MHGLSSQNRAMGNNRVALNPVWYPACHSKGYPGASGQSGQNRINLGHSGRAPKSELKAPTLSVLGLRGTAATAAAALSRPLPMEAPAVQKLHCQVFKAGQ